MGTIAVVRVYDRDPPPAGKVFLVDRLWPRGVRRDALDLAGWLEDAAPSHDLRQWYAHNPERWSEFRRRYFAELDACPDAWRPLAGAAGEDVTLLYRSRDRERNNAAALREYLLTRTDQR